MTGTNRDKTVTVDKAYFWRKITPLTPRGQKMQLIHKPSGVATYGALAGPNPWFTHWAPLPVFDNSDDA